jgi:hypothetical protein
VKCPTCSEAGAEYVGTPIAETDHFLARALWDLHKTRQAVNARGYREMSLLLSEQIRSLEHLADLLNASRAH